MKNLRFKIGWAWPQHVSDFFKQAIHGLSLHVFCGSSKLGDVRVDLYTKNATVKADALHLPFKPVFDTVFGDPAWHTAKHLRSKIMYELREVLKPDGDLLLNANWYPNRLRGCQRSEQILVSRPRMPFGNAAFILRYKRLPVYRQENLEETRK